MRWTELTAPAALPIDLETVKSNLRLTTNDEDGLLAFYVEAATDLFERETSQRLISRSFLLELEDFPFLTDKEGIELPFGPVSSITSIQYYATDGVLTTWAPSNYILDTAKHFPTIYLAPSLTFPTTQDDRHDGVRITFTAGYGEGAESVPRGIQWAIVVLAAHFFMNRSPVNIGNIVNEIPSHLRAAIDAFKRMKA